MEKLSRGYRINRGRRRRCRPRHLGEDARPDRAVSRQAQRNAQDGICSSRPRKVASTRCTRCCSASVTSRSSTTTAPSATTTRPAIFSEVVEIAKEVKSIQDQTKFSASRRSSARTAVHVPGRRQHRRDDRHVRDQRARTSPAAACPSWPTSPPPARCRRRSTRRPVSARCRTSTRRSRTCPPCVATSARSRTVWSTVWPTWRPTRRT